ncbi:MAG: AAA family ATPase [Erysipelotrichaceae bacterium]
MSLYIDNFEIKGITLIFLDEIQHCPNARTVLKFLAIDDRADIIASGSLLGLHYKGILSIPVGYERQIDMYSLDFEEFLWALGYDIKPVLKKYFDECKMITEAINSKYQDLFRR